MGTTLAGQDLTGKLLANHQPLFSNPAVVRFILWESSLWQREVRVKGNGTRAETESCQGPGRRCEPEQTATLSEHGSGRVSFYREVFAQSRNDLLTGEMS